MKRLHHRVFVIALLACFLFVSGALAGQVVQHTFHHAHHKATTHANPLCTWMCASGQVLQGFEFGLKGIFFTLFLVEPRNAATIPVALAWSPPLRGPPVRTSIS